MRHFPQYTTLFHPLHTATKAVVKTWHDYYEFQNSRGAQAYIPNWEAKLDGLVEKYGVAWLNSTTHKHTANDIYFILTQR